LLLIEETLVLGIAQHNICLCIQNTTYRNWAWKWGNVCWFQRKACFPETIYHRIYCLHIIRVLWLSQ